MNKAIILDFDGTIADTEVEWIRVENNWFKSMMPNTWEDEHHDSIVGLNTHALHSKLAKEFGLHVTYNDFEDHVNNLAIEVYDNCPMVSGMNDVIAEIQAAKIPLGLATSSKRAWLERALKRFGISDAFDVIITADETPKGEGKPHPTPYLLAAKALGVIPTPETIITAEDSTNGVGSAVAAETYCIAIRSHHNQKQDLSAAHKIVYTSKELLEEIFCKIT